MATLIGFAGFLYNQHLLLITQALSLDPKPWRKLLQEKMLAPFRHAACMAGQPKAVAEGAARQFANGVSRKEIFAAFLTFFSMLTSQLYKEIKNIIRKLIENHRLKRSK